MAAKTLCEPMQTRLIRADFVEAEEASQVNTMSPDLDLNEPANGIITLYEPSSDTCNVE